MTGIVLNFAGVTATSAPGAPEIGSVTIVGQTATVPFTAPVSNGGAAITSYTATSSPGGYTGTLSQAGSGSVVVSGLAGGTSYTFTVTATNAIGTGAASAASNSVTAIATGQQSYTSSGTYSWVAPAGVTKISVLAIGRGGNGSPAIECCGNVFSGGGGGGGGLAFRNNQTVTPGASYSVTITPWAQGVTGVDGSYMMDTGFVMGKHGKNAWGNGNSGGASYQFNLLAESGYSGRSGGAGGAGNGGAGWNAGGGGGGGAGGYLACGGAAGNAGDTHSGGQPGGGGGGGGKASSGYIRGGGGGGGVGVLGIGSSGAGGTNGSGGGGGSCGTAGSSSGTSVYGQGGGTYGGGGGGGAAGNSSAALYGGGAGGSAIVRIIWPGNTRVFPSTNTGNM